MNRAGLERVFLAAVAAVEPARLVADALGSRVSRSAGPVTVLALGKAAAAMARGAADYFDTPVRGVAVLPGPAALPPGVRGVVGSHPIPDSRSLAAGDALLEEAHAASRHGITLVLVSGGGSALAERPVAGVAIEDIARLSADLMAAGADIEELNAVRVALSELKGGGLAAAAAPSRLLTLAISDVGAAPPHVIASGPTLVPPDESPAAQAILEKYGLFDGCPPGVAGAITGQRQQSPVDQEFAVIADGVAAARAAAHEVVAAGFTPVVATESLRGEARVAAEAVVTAPAAPGEVAIYWGETTVTVSGSGRGGRNHEAALAAAILLDGATGVFLAGGTDGVDGMAGGAGAVVDGSTVAAAKDAGIDAGAFLENNDSGGFFDLVPGRIDIGASGTNVADLWLFSPGSGAHRDNAQGSGSASR